MMKNPKFIISCLVSVMLVTAASATWVPITDEVLLSSLLVQGSSLIFGDKEISEFSGSAPDLNAIKVQGGKNSITGDYGLKFTCSLIAAPNETINATLRFKVSVLPGYDERIKDVQLCLTGVSVNGSGIVAIGEEVWDRPFYTPGTVPIALLNCSKWKDSPLDYLVDHAEFAPVKEIWIYSKDISIKGGINGSAHLSEFYQYYSQIPEPATLVLLGLGALSLLRRKRKA